MCTISDDTHEVEVELKIDTQVIPKRGSFRYRKSIIQRNKKIDDDVAHHIRVDR